MAVRRWYVGEKKREMTELEMEILEINRGKTDRMHGKKQSEETCKRSNGKSHK